MTRFTKESNVYLFQKMCFLDEKKFKLEKISCFLNKSDEKNNKLN